MILDGTVGLLPSWFAQAACLGMPSEVFFPEGPGSSPRAALEVCAECPVRQASKRVA